jgi:hypothetical protein
MRRKDFQARIVDRDDQRHDPGATADLSTELHGALVTMVPVGDQELRARERRGIEVVEPPKPRAAGLDIGRALRSLQVERGVGQEQDGLGLNSRGSKEPQALLANPGMSALVREDASDLVRLRRQRHGHTAAFPRDSVRADVVLDLEPEGGLVVTLQDPPATQSRYRRPASSADSGSVTCTTLKGLRVKRSARSLGSTASYGGATRSASDPAAPE